jgi:hypothetical protein
VLSGEPGLTSLVATDNVNNALAVLNETSGLVFAGLFSGSTGGTFHVWTAPLGVLNDAAYAVTRFVNGAKFGSTVTAVTSTDNVGSQAVTIAPSGHITPGEMCSSAPAAAGYYCDGKTGAWTALPSTTVATWSPYFGGSLVSTNSAAQMTPPAAITIVRLEIFALTAFGTCSTSYPVVGIYDQTAGSMIVSQTLTSGQGPWDTGAISVAVPAGHVLRFRTGTAGVGCGSSVVLMPTMQYHS